MLQLFEEFEGMNFNVIYFGLQLVWLFLVQRELSVNRGRKYLWRYTVMDCSVGTRRRKIPVERDQYFCGFVKAKILALCLTFPGKNASYSLVT